MATATLETLPDDTPETEMRITMTSTLENLPDAEIKRIVHNKFLPSHFPHYDDQVRNMSIATLLAYL